MKKIFTLLLTILLSIILFSCIDDEIIPKEEIVLPNRHQPINEKSDETIYISADPIGNLNTIKVTKHLRKTTFNYYETYGTFMDNGHLNISYGNASVIIEGDRALIPSLENTDNLFYMLNLDPSQYKDKIPFNVSINYYLNDEKINYEYLKGVNGEIKLEIIITPNLTAHDYFKNFGAQIQIPIDLTKAEILEHNGSLAEIQTGQKTTLAYMILPNGEQTISIKLLASNFSFEGIDISFQKLDILDVLTNFIDLDSLSFDELFDPSNLEVLVQSVNMMDTELKPLFSNLTNFTYLSDPQLFLTVGELTEQLNSANFMTGLNISKNMLNPDLENKAFYDTQFDALNDTVITLIDLLTNTLSSIDPSLFVELSALTTPLVNYPNYYSHFEKIVKNINEINSFYEFADSNIFDEILSGNLLVIDGLKDLSNKGLEVEFLFDTLIKNMYAFPLDLKPFVDGLPELSNQLINLFAIFEILNNLNTTLTTYANLITDLKVLDAFISTEYVDMFLDGLIKDSLEQPGILSVLSYLGFIEIDEEKIGQLFTLNQLYIPISGNIRSIDEIILGFIELNSGLNIKQENQQFSFYKMMDKLNLLITILEELPLVNENDIVSFLHKNNIPPNQVSFILKIAGF